MAEQQSEWRRGWRTVASGAVGVVFMTGVASVTGIVMAPLMAEFGWSRALITSNVLICSVMTLVLAPVLGRLIHRFGPRRCALGAVAAVVPALWLVALAGGSPVMWILTWTLFAVVNVGITPITWSGAVAGLFDRSRGAALAITLSGAGAAFFIFPPFAVAVMERFGWRGVYGGLGLLILVILLPLIFFWFRGVDDFGSGREGAGAAAAARPSGYSLREAMRRVQFWQFGLVAVLMALAQGALQVHLFPILQEGGLAPDRAAWVLAVMGGAMIAGRLLTGLMLDWLPPLPVFSGALLLVLVACVLAANFSGSTVEGAAVSFCLGFGTGGTTSALAYLSSRYFGLAAYPAIYGLLMGLFSIGYGTAPVIAGYLRETTNSYTPVFDGLAAALALAVVLTWLLGRPKFARDATT